MRLQRVPSESRSRTEVQNVKTVCHGNTFDAKQNHFNSVAGNADVNQSKPLCCFYYTCKLRSIIRTLLPFTVWSLYMCAGSLLFTVLEGQGNAERRKRLVQLQEAFPRQMSELVIFLTDNCSGNATAHVMLVDSLRIDVVDFLEKAQLGPDAKPWTFFSSLIFCLTALSTIGYGYLAPKTQLGRGLCIVYTCIGLPLNLIFMACVGRNLARFIGSVYNKLKHMCSWTISLKNLGLKQHTGKLDTGEAQAAKRKALEMSATVVDVPDVRVTNAEKVNEISMDTPKRMSSPNGLPNYATQYQQWADREGDTRSLSQSDLPRTPSRSTIAESLEVQKMNHLHHHNDSAPDVPMVFLVLLIGVYCCVGAWFMWMKNSLWTFLDGVYFWFITITTVGFGDLEFQTRRVENQDDGYEAALIQIAVIAFVVVGLALMSACVTLCIERGNQYRRALQRLMCNSVNDLGEGN